MDQPTSSPDAPDCPAASPDPASTRPNPFDEDVNSARKRRRTSPSDSPSRSSSSDASDSVMEQADHSPATGASVMNIDQASPRPATPEHKTIASELMAQHSASRVTTINLRHHGGLDGAADPETLSQEHMSNGQPSQPVHDHDSRRRQPDMRRTSFDSEGRATPASSTIATNSPDNGAVAVPTNGGAPATEDSEVTILGEQPAFDFVRDFPFQGESRQEYIADVVVRAIQFLHSSHSAGADDVDVLDQLSIWLTKSAFSFRRLGTERVTACICNHQTFWAKLQELVFQINYKRQRYAMNSHARLLANGFLVAIADFVALLVQTDIENLERHRTDPTFAETVPFLTSSRLLAVFGTITRQLAGDQRGGHEQAYLTLQEDGELVRGFLDAPGGGLNLLLKLAQVQIALLPRHPQLANNLEYPSATADGVLSIIRIIQIRDVPMSSDFLTTAKVRLALGLQFFDIVAEALSTSIDQRVTHLNPGQTENLITHLGEILLHGMSTGHDTSMQRLNLLRHQFPDLPDQYLLRMASWKWRLGVQCRLIQSSQMQLRVTAVRLTCEELVNLWKQSPKDQDGSAFMAHLAEYLDSLHIVDYVLDPTCHPEITSQSGNIVGYLVVTGRYRSEHTDLLWRSIMGAEDGRGSEPLVSLLTPVIPLMGKEQLLYFLGKFQDLSVTNISITALKMFDFAMNAFLHLPQLDWGEGGPFVLGLLMRLLREASTVVGPESRVANIDVHKTATAKLRVFLNASPGDIRTTLFADCCANIAAKSTTTLGSLWCLSTLVRSGPALAGDMHTLTMEHDFTRILIEELEHTAQMAPRLGLLTMIQGTGNSPRSHFINAILKYEAATITDELGMRLLDILVGPKAISQQDRETAWRILNRTGLDGGYDNPFLVACFTEYIPRLSPDHIHTDTVDFVKNIVLKKVNPVRITSSEDYALEESPATEDDALDGEMNIVQIGIEQLWRMLLSTDSEPLADTMVRTLVDDVYIGSACIMSYPHHRARQVHLRLVERCLKQLEGAATELGESSSVEAMASDLGGQQANERVFTRSLAVLQSFMTAYHSNAHFSAPDFRTLMLPTPEPMRGEPANLKYQSFDGTTQTRVQPVVIGRQNSAASLLAVLKEVTGFENFRLYYRGTLFTLNGQGAIASLETLRLTDGLLLIKREVPGATTPVGTVPGTSALEMEVMRHFPQLWAYLSMRSFLARQIYQLLTNLPADTQILATIKAPSSTYLDMFPKGEPYKCLYAIYALEKYLQSTRQTLSRPAWEGVGDQGADTESSKMILRVRVLVADALADSELLEDRQGVLPQHQLSSSLMGLYLETLQGGIEQGDTSIGEVGTLAVDRLTELLCTGMQHPRRDCCLDLVQTTFRTLLLACALSASTWEDFKKHPGTTVLIQNLLLNEEEGSVRQQTCAVLREICAMGIGTIARCASDPNQMAVPPTEFRQFFWQTVKSMFPEAAGLSNQSCEFFSFVSSLTNYLLKVEKSNSLDVQDLVRQSCQLLEGHETTETLGVAFEEDMVAAYVAGILNMCLSTRSDSTSESWDFPPRLADNLFWRHLFPSDRKRKGDGVPRSILSSRARNYLYDIILAVTKNSEDSTIEVLKSLNKVTFFDKSDEFGYMYDMSWNVDRIAEVRATCGYAGLRNLGNTCYSNSLITQLFMNTRFRQFMIHARVDDDDSQELLLETQKVFSYLQDANRRFVDPVHMIGSIKTYDDTMIDVTQQMDVDEFFNLLFDRWEGQLPDAKDKQTFRTFYGGQLVQQVSSKECEHISERFEPFSAIQCDVRGHKNLTDSLQAYVDGEVMAGDNKYKCSTCDRHVDAVKRACLKDIPDNLIFHLKRFDFNLRTMTRSKINDHFAFPSQIDMRPYTIEHLSGSQDRDEDIFELAGVLVHTGTAEIGHYYSYIRERPTPGDKEVWLEFNDDTVNFWDPANMEEATFGSSQSRTFEQGGFTFEKSHNAYMLFYVRSSSLKAQKDAVIAQKLPMPLKAPLPSEFYETIMNDNVTWLRRFCLYDEDYHRFALRFCVRILSMQTWHNASSGRRAKAKAMAVLLSVFDQAVTRTKSLNTVSEYRDAILDAIEVSTEHALAVVEYFYDTREPLRQLVQRNPDADIRAMAGDIFIHALKQLRLKEPVAYGLHATHPLEFNDEGIVVGACLELFDVLWRQFQINLRSWPETFGLVQKFADLGHLETALLLKDNWMAKLMMLIATDETYPNLPEPYRKLNNILFRRAQSHSRQPSYTEIVGLLSSLLRRLSRSPLSGFVELAEERIESHLGDPDGLLPWCRDEIGILQQEYNHSGSIFIRRLVEIGQETPVVQKVIRQLSEGDVTTQDTLLKALHCGFLQSLEIYSIRPYLLATHTFVLTHPQTQRSSDLVEAVVRAAMEPGTEGRAYLDFFEKYHTALAPGPDSTVPSEVLEIIPLWSPALLGYPNKRVADDVEQYIRHQVFSLEGDDEEDEHLRALMVVKAKELAVRCLGQLKHFYVGRRNTLESTQNLRNIVAFCETVFGDDHPGDVGAFVKNRTDIYNDLQLMLVDELDDEGSGMSPYSDMTEGTIDLEG